LGELVNLRRERKRIARRRDAAEAEANRALHGRTKAERERMANEESRFRSRVDGARLDQPQGDPVTKK